MIKLINDYINRNSRHYSTLGQLLTDVGIMLVVMVVFLATFAFIVETVSGFFS